MQTQNLGWFQMSVWVIQGDEKQLVLANTIEFFDGILIRCLLMNTGRLAISSCHSPYVINVFARLIFHRWNFNGFLRINFAMTNGIFRKYRATLCANFSAKYFAISSNIILSSPFNSRLRINFSNKFLKRRNSIEILNIINLL